MTRDEIIRMARVAGDSWDDTLPSDKAFLERFAALVAAAEREACADFLEHGVFDDDSYHKQYAKAIRARGHV